MNHKYLAGLLLTILFVSNVFVPVKIISQNTSFNPNSMLINGPVYYQSNILAKGSAYLFAEFTSATVYSCDRIYNNVEINYELVDQQLIILHNTLGDSTRIPVMINQVLIDSFTVNGYKFINAVKLEVDMGFPYLMEINQGDIRLLLSFKKDLVKNYSQNNEYGKISSLKKYAFIMSDNGVFPIRSLRGLKDYYQDNWKSIRDIIRKKKLKLKSSSYEELTELMDFSNQISN